MALIQRYKDILTGRLILTGNTLMLYNGVSPPSANGFTTTVPNTTNIWQQNASRAVLTIPPGSTVEYAELTWSSILSSGTFDVSANKNNPVTFVTPVTTTTVAPQATDDTGTNAIYTRSANVTDLVKAGGSGSYTVGGVAGLNGTQTATNAIGWYLSVVINSPSEKYRLFQINVGNQFVPGSSSIDFTISGFSTPSSGPVTGKLFAGIQRGDPGADLITVSVGPTASNLNLQLTRPPLPSNNMIIGIISNTDTGALIDTSGTFGNNNNITSPPTAVPNARFHWDIASFDISPSLLNSQTSFVTRSLSQTTNSVFDYNVYDLQIDVQSPFLPPITKTVDKAFADIGDTLTYTVTLANTGTITALNAVFKDTIPSGTTFVNNSLTVNNVPQTGLNPQDGVSLGDLAINKVTTITFQVTVNTIPTPTNTIPNTSYISYEFVSAPGTDTISDTKPSNTVNTAVNHVDLSSNKIVDKSFADIGDTITYTIPIKNIGTTTATNILFIDTIPSGTSLVIGSFTQNGSPLGGSPNPPGINLNNIPIGSTTTIVFSVTVNTIPNPNPIPNIATIGYSYVIDPSISRTTTSGISTNTVTTQVNNANLGNIVKGVDKSYAKIGDILTYIITIPNSGNVTANSVIFKDTIPSGTSFVANSVIINGAVQNGFVVAPPTGANVGTIGANSVATLSFKVTVDTIPSPNPISNSGNVSYSYILDTVSGATISGSNNTNIVSTTINDAILTSSKIVTPTNTTVGSVINYTIILSNSGNATASNVVFIDTIPNGTSFVTNSFAINGATQTGANPSPPGGVNIPNIAPNGVATLTFQVTVDTIPTPNPIPNSSTTNYTFIIDPTTGATLPSSSNSNIVTTYVNPESNPLKIVDKQYAVPGDILTYTVQWENRLVVTATDVVLIDTIPTDTTFVSNSVTVNGSTVSGVTVAPPSGLNVGTIPAGVFTTVTFKVTVTNTIPSTNPIPNQAIGRYSYISDPTLGTITTETAVSNFVSTQVNIASIPSATKVVDKAYATVGDVLTYTLSFTNIGNTTATNVKLIDTIPNNTTFVINSVFVNGSNQPGAVVAPPTGLSVGSLGINATATVVFQITVNTVPNPNPIPNIGFVSYNYVIDPIALTNGNGSVNTNLVNTQVNYADFGIAGKTVNKTFSNIGDILTYTIVYTNTGNVTANNVIISDTIPNDTAFEASSVIINNTPNTTTVPVGNVLIISAGNVAPNSTATLTFKVNITTAPNPNPIPNSASSSFTYTVDPALPNGVTSGKNTNIVNTQVNSASLGGITKFVDKAYAICGEILTYTISIPNSGNITATNVVLSDTVPNGTSFISNSILVNGSTVGGTPQSVALGSIAPGATTTVSYEVTVVC